MVEEVLPKSSPEPHYWAFISYSHRDAKQANWLHKSMETYRVHKKLVGSIGRTGEPVRDRAYPVFIDRDDCEGAADLVLMSEVTKGWRR